MAQFPVTNIFRIRAKDFSFELKYLNLLHNILNLLIVLLQIGNFMSDVDRIHLE